MRAILISLFFIWSGLLFAQSDRTFIKHYGTTGSEYGISLTVNQDNSIVFVQTLYEGANHGMTVTKTDANGQILWSTPFYLHAETVPKQIERAGTGYLVYGSTMDDGMSPYFLFLSYFNASGQLIWTKEYRVSASDNAAGFALLDNKIYLAFTADYNSPSVYPKMAMIRTDASGNVEKCRIYTAPFMFSCLAMAVNADEKIGLAGQSNGCGQGTPSFMNGVLLQIDTALDLEWSSYFGTYYDDDVNAIVASDDQWLITGRSVFMTTGWDASLFRFDFNGQFLSSGFYDSGTDEAGRTIIPHDNGSVVFAGDEGTFDERNMALTMVDASNNVVWSKRYPVNPFFTNYAFELDKLYSDSGFVFTGDLRPPSAYRNASLFRTDNSGNIQCYTSNWNLNRIVQPIELSDTTIQLTDTIVQEVNVQANELLVNYREFYICRSVFADFTYNQSADCPQVCFTFNDASAGAQQWYWEFPGGSPAYYSGQQPPPVCFDSVRSSDVRLLIFVGTDTISKTQTITFEEKCDTLFIPNVITPNKDGLNDRFLIKNLPDQFKLYIYNRWGALVFETDRPDFIWPEQEKPFHDGVYYYTLVLPGSNRTGTVSIINSD